MFTLLLLIVLVLLVIHAKVRYVDYTLWISFDFTRMVKSIKNFVDKL